VSVINRFNQISQWVATVVVLGDTKEVRVTAINQFLLVAKECLHFNNYNSVLGVISGLTSVAVSRLVQTWHGVDGASMKTFEKLKAIVSIEHKFKELREAQENVDGPCVPYLGVYLMDLTQIEEGNPDTTTDHLFNFEKYSMIAEIILRIDELKKHRYQLLPVEVIQDYLKNLFVLGEEEIFEESLKREGKEENKKFKAKLGKKVKNLL